MQKFNRNGVPACELIPYTLPTYHRGKTSFVSFMCYDPAQGKMRRKRYYLDHIKSIRARKHRAAELIAAITRKLAEGWNVWTDTGKRRQYTKFAEVCANYLRHLAKLAESRALKSTTYKRNESYLNNFRSYIDNTPPPVIYAYQVNRQLLTDFLDHLFLDRDVSANTRNNYRAWLATFCRFMVDKQYLDANPADSIPALPEVPKHRAPLTKKDLRLLRSHLLATDRRFLLACMMEYYTFIRPNELAHVRIGDIHVKEQKIFVPAAVSKNRRDGMVGLNERIIRLMIELDIFSHPSGHYLFSTRDFFPGPTIANTHLFRDRFASLRKELHWPDKYQFYSLKDSGIRDLAQAKGIVIARDQARHRDISTTNAYLCGSDLPVHEETKHFDGDL